LPENEIEGRKHQILKQEKVKANILDAARKIVAEEGLQGLSVRKITRRIDYTPGIIYHYFHNMEAIIEALASEGYQRILASIAAVARNEKQPEAEIKEAFTKYIQAALAAPQEYKAFLLSDNPSILTKTALLAMGTLEHSRTLQVLGNCIQRGIDMGRFVACDPELTAQILWTATYGLILKIIMEGNIPPVQIDRLIDHHFTLLFHGLMATNMKTDSVKES
jgi:AcrR family transcriptional regulator